MNSKKEEIRIKPNTKMYDVSSYTDRELLDILDLSSPTDRELEAKIIFLINNIKSSLLIVIRINETHKYLIIKIL